MDRHEALGFLPLKDEEAGRLLASIPADERLECWWLVRTDGTPVAGNRGGGVEILRELRLTRPLGGLLRALRLSRAVDVADDLLARCRKQLGRFVPEGPAPKRYP